MEKWDIEDFIEEVKFQMTEYEALTEEIILDWEKKARMWISNNIDGKHIIAKTEEDIFITIKDENIMYDIALRFNNLYRKGMIEKYWNEFKL